MAAIEHHLEDGIRRKYIDDLWRYPNEQARMLNVSPKYILLKLLYSGHLLIVTKEIVNSFKIKKEYLMLIF